MTRQACHDGPAIVKRACHRCALLLPARQFASLGEKLVRKPDSTQQAGYSLGLVRGRPDERAQIVERRMPVEPAHEHIMKDGEIGHERARLRDERDVVHMGAVDEIE